ncbi:MAG: 2,3-diphosphoglycerate synthetase [Actinomycetota bacterium]
MKVIVLVDGEHYPPVTRWGIASAISMGHEVLAAVFVGGAEKIAAGALPDLGVPVVDGHSDARSSLAAAIDEHRPEGVLDLSDEPVLGYRQRMELASVALAAGAVYFGADFRFDPPLWGGPLDVATVAVIGTGKRTGKTAIAGEVARVAASLGRKPVIVAMGRGGPPAPQVAAPGDVTLDRLVELARGGEHAASDYLEDAAFTGVPAVGARRCGGGLAGRPFVTNAAEAANVALGLGADLLVLEGSGSAMPPVPWDAGILVVPASIPEEYLAGYLGPLRVLLADLIVITMTSGPSTGPQALSTLRSHLRRLKPGIRLVATDFEPVPLEDVQGKTVFLATTAPQEVARRQAESLEATAGCRVVGRSHHLADRGALEADLSDAPAYDVLLTELKAAAIDVAAEHARKRGAGVVFVDNRAVSVDEDADVRELVAEVIDLAHTRHRERA